MVNLFTLVFAQHTQTPEKMERRGSTIDLALDVNRHQLPSSALSLNKADHHHYHHHRHHFFSSNNRNSIYISIRTWRLIPLCIYDNVYHLSSHQTNRHITHTVCQIHYPLYFYKILHTVMMMMMMIEPDHWENCNWISYSSLSSLNKYYGRVKLICSIRIRSMSRFTPISNKTKRKMIELLFFFKRLGWSCIEIINLIRMMMMMMMST